MLVASGKDKNINIWNNGNIKSDPDTTFKAPHHARGLDTDG